MKRSAMTYRFILCDGVNPSKSNFLVQSPKCLQITLLTKMIDVIYMDCFVFYASEHVHAKIFCPNKGNAPGRNDSVSCINSI